MRGEQLETLWTHREAARWLRTSDWTLYQLVSNGEGPPAYRLGRERRYEPGEVRAWLHRFRVIPDVVPALEDDDEQAPGEPDPEVVLVAEGDVPAEPVERWEGRDWQQD